MLSSSSSSKRVTRTHTTRSKRLHAQKKKKDDNEEEEGEEEDNDNSTTSNSGVGMERAFQQLERLSFSPEESKIPENNVTTATAAVTKIQASVEDLQLLSSQTTSLPTPTPEQEVVLYKNMLQELEQTTEEDLYSNVLQDMGGGSTASSNTSASATRPANTNVVEPTPPKPITSADFLNQALAEALQQVQVNSPSAVDSILDDPQFMNEIEAIFERGNAQLLEGLEAVRREQEQLTQASIQQAQEQKDDSETQARLEAAERSIQTVLNRVQQERTNVEQAVQDLQRAQEQEPTSNRLLQLKQSPVKQGALIGFLLFTLRSLTDSFSALNDPSQWTVALVQGAIALACAAAFYLL